MIRRLLGLYLVGLALFDPAFGQATATATFVAADAVSHRRLSVAEYRDRMQAGWIGQMAAVAWAAPTEFKYRGEIMPESAVPAWSPAKINDAFDQDDLYVEMTFLRSMELHGLDVSAKQAGIDFARTTYRLWHANVAGRLNLRRGIAPPDSGHPKNNPHADDIDYQIEADYSGLIAPGQPNTVIALGEKFGRIMNYGDGLYGGLFIGGMYAEAFFESDPEKLVRAGLACVPAGSQYHECITDVLAWWKQNPDDWQKTWQLVDDKYQKNPAYRRLVCDQARARPGFNIDAKINGAYVTIGLLYGGGDPDKTIIISTRCGQDSDCNPSSAAGVLFAAMGKANLPERFTSGLDGGREFANTPYNFAKLAEVCEQLARQTIAQAGGRVETDADGNEVFVIPVQTAKPPAMEQSWQPGPTADSTYTPEELAKIREGL